MYDEIFCGIEGGSSVSKLVLVKADGSVLCWVEGPSTNHLLVGLEECQKRIANMISQAKEKAGLDANIILAGLGLCMSGCEQDDSNRNFERHFLQKYSYVTKSCTVASDTVGPLLTASPKGGLVIIAGTGSNSLLINPDGTSARCGGWGHLIGDEASAMWISLRAVKTVFNSEDNFESSPYDVSRVKKLMLEHFKVKDKFGILEHCYVNFKKSYFASLCAKLAKVAQKEKDELCCQLFYDAGKVLADIVRALLPKVQEELKQAEGGLPIVCVGSVFQSWNLLKQGFIDGMDSELEEYVLVTLKNSSAVGAAYLGAKAVGSILPLDFEKNTSVLYHYKKN